MEIVSPFANLQSIWLQLSVQFVLCACVCALNALIDAHTQKKSNWCRIDVGSCRLCFFSSFQDGCNSVPVSLYNVQV